VVDSLARGNRRRRIWFNWEMLGNFSGDGAWGFPSYVRTNRRDFSIGIAVVAALLIVQLPSTR
jgi:hypothetical protein